MRTGRAPRCRGVDNWTRVVESFTGSADTLYNNAMKELKLLVNNEITGANGATKVFKRECQPPQERDPLTAVLRPCQQLINLFFVLCAALMGVSPKADKSVLHHFGKRHDDNESSFRVYSSSTIYLHIPVIVLEIPTGYLADTYTHLHTYMIPFRFLHILYDT